MMIKKVLLTILSLFLLGVFVLYLITFQVDFDKATLLTTFGEASEKSVVNANGEEAGLHFKWPYPIQDIRTFERRTMVFNDRLEQQETRDKQVVILKTYTAWKIVEPLSFYRSFKTTEYCERFLSERLRAARSEIGNFSFDDLTNTNPQKLRLAEAELAIFNRVKEDLKNQKCGIEILSIGITRIILPSQITQNVFTRMGQTRQRLAQKALSEGDAIALGIRTKADSECARIMAYAEREAQNIRAEGDAQAAQYYQDFAKNEDLAIFLRNIEALKETLKYNSTFLLNTDIVPFDLLKSLQKGEPRK